MSIGLVKKVSGYFLLLSIWVSGSMLVPVRVGAQTKTDTDKPAVKSKKKVVDEIHG